MLTGKLMCIFVGFRTIYLAPDKSVVSVEFGGGFDPAPNRAQDDKASVKPRERSLGSSRCKKLTTLGEFHNSSCHLLRYD